MTLAKFNNVASGVNFDSSPEEIAANDKAFAWNGATQNMRFADGYASRFRGFTQIFNTPSITPYALAPYATATKRFWVYAGLTAVWVDDGTTKTDITGTAPTGAIDDRWQLNTLNGVLVTNNGKDVPSYWGGDTSLNLATLPGWDASWRAWSIRPFKNFLIALRFVKGSSLFPHMIKWSSRAVPGAIPASWDENDPTEDTGEQDIAQTSDILVDGMQLGDAFIVYKERSMYAMTEIGVPDIFRFQRLPGEIGILARGCVTDTPLGHVVLTAGDVVLHSGQQPVSIANAQVRNAIFNSINTSLFYRAYVTQNPQKNEVWVCIPTADSTVCNVAYVWNWVDKTWAVRTLTNATYGAHGQIPMGTGSDTWSSVSGTWDTTDRTWTENEYSPAEARLLMSHTNPLISLADAGSSDLGGSISAVLERTGIPLSDANLVKTASNIYPRIDGPAGQTINVYVGFSMLPDSPPVYQAAIPFIPGVDRQVDFFITGRFMAVKFESTGYQRWRIRSFDTDYRDVGYY